ncbi:MAG: LTA synthase family protein [Eubacterium sp.]|nr:LTA synthase family protein [Eubacterium sp.]
MFIIISSIVAAVAILFEYNFTADKKSYKSFMCIAVKNLFSVNLLSLAIQRYVLKFKHFLVTGKYHTAHFIKYLIVSLVVAAFLQLVFAVFNGKLIFKIPEDYEKRKKHTAIKVISVILFALGAAAFFGTIWGGTAFGKVTGDQLIINLFSPTEGTEASVYLDGCEGPVFQTLLTTTFFALFTFSKFEFVFKKLKRSKVVFSLLAKRILCFLLALATLAGGVWYGVEKFALVQVFNAYVLKSDFIDEQYVDPEQASITFPEKKRNLIYIYLESMENTFMSKKQGGYMQENLIPNLTEIAKEGTVFSNTDNYYGGPLQGTGTQWSIASMVNQFTGLPMKAPGWKNTYGTDGKFLPGAYTLGEILEKQGYEQTFMVGSNANFGGLRYLYSTHGNWKIVDYNNAKKLGLIPRDYKQWWGYEDDTLYRLAKDELTRLYQSGKPFNLVIENADTHRPGGFVSPGKEMPQKSHYANALWNSDRDVKALIDWIKQQPFYDNTTIVLIGDHLTMDSKFIDDCRIPKSYLRTQYNVILNADPSLGVPDKKVTQNRKWSNWDMYPTVIASVGGKIDGERLGIGTNLYSGKQTVYEEFGAKKVDKELEKGSEFYNENILGNKDLMKVVNKKGVKHKKSYRQAN